MLMTWLMTLGQTPETSTGIQIVRGKIAKVSPLLKKGDSSGQAESESDQAGEFNGQFRDVFTQNSFNEVPLLGRSAPRNE